MFQERELKRNRLIGRLLGGKTLAIAAIAAMLASVVPLYVILYVRPNSNTAASSPEVAPSQLIRTVNALGRLEPAGGVIRLSASLPPEGARVGELRVQTGDPVTAGQVIAVLDNYGRLAARLEQAKREVDVAHASLIRVQTGAEVGEIEAQNALIRQLEAQLDGELQMQDAMIARLDAELNNATAEYQRHQDLYAAGAISESLLDTQRLTVETLQQRKVEATANLQRTVNTTQEQITRAKEDLRQLKHVLPADIEMAKAEVERAIAVVQQAEADLELAYVRAPIDGQVLTRHALPGEVIGPEGIVELGQTQQMYAIAEVYETDVSNLRIGQQATILSENGGFTGELQGTVEEIGLQIGQRNVLDTDPAARVDVRVVEVKVRLTPEDSQRVASLTNLRVRIAINI